MSKARKVTPEMAAEMQCLRDEGMTAQQIAEKYGLNIATVCIHTNTPDNRKNEPIIRTGWTQEWEETRETILKRLKNKNEGNKMATKTKIKEERRYTTQKYESSQQYRNPITKAEVRRKRRDIRLGQIIKLRQVVPVPDDDTENLYRDELCRVCAKFPYIIILKRPNGTETSRTYVELCLADRGQVI